MGRSAPARNRPGPLHDQTCVCYHDSARVTLYPIAPLSIGPISSRGSPITGKSEMALQDHLQGPREVRVPGSQGPSAESSQAEEAASVRSNPAEILEVLFRGHNDEMCWIDLEMTSSTATLMHTWPNDGFISICEKWSSAVLEEAILINTVFHLFYVMPADSYFKVSETKMLMLKW